MCIAYFQPITLGELSSFFGKEVSRDLIAVLRVQELIASGPRSPQPGAPYTRPAYADAIRAAVGGSGKTADLTQSEVLVLMCIGYFQPITRAELSSFFGKEISRDFIGHLRGAGLIASGPRSPTPGAPYTYVTTKEFLLEFGLDTLRDLPDFEALEDAGLLSKEKLLAGDIMPGLYNDEEEHA
ncbi:SMC-Scp complex subunit ScpB [Mesorhizobium mediterraneum]|uniref:SMC-Scp complex subunit ScpB n=1 Tax=Mesorhizobium TaxID=68287 RepID=UPI001FDA23C6|nr:MULTISPECIES: SMC-Scp complex subunit ScpB [Mesorhizobium]WIW55369.1 SMC-Scp complex subunit ScpB [Mesorhizobium mediterraneum]